MSNEASSEKFRLPEYDTSKAAQQVGHLDLESCCRIAKWSSDGSTILMMNEDRRIGIYHTDYENHDSKIEHVCSFRQGSPIYDVLWYPWATSSSNPATYCFLASLRDAPVKLLDANDGRLRASYKIVDHRERFVAPHSMTFNLTGERIYCGFLDAIEVFDLASPGEGTRLLTIPNKKSKDGLRGIISALSFCPDYSGLFAAGTFNSSIGLFSEETGGQVLMYLEKVAGPIMQLQFHPAQPNLLFATCRRRDGIFIWDVRNTSLLYHSLDMSYNSNQRLRFDIDPAGKWLAAGGGDGFVQYYDVSSLQTSEPILRFRAHTDAVSTTGFHPTQPLMLTVSGSHQFMSERATSGTASDSDSSLEEGEINTVPEGNPTEPTSEGAGVRLSVTSEKIGNIVVPKTKIIIPESSMKLWRL
ncbi:WD40 repeat-like protein [Serendipita vermifera]|nr:WD40 repeat-like protein [Serendipita vermifera]